ncbi:MAG: hypothetical protein AVDCRST_MAG78-271, partial [uncultured Rubrobacteraceae bacterium]
GVRRGTDLHRPGGAAGGARSAAGGYSGAAPHLRVGGAEVPGPWRGRRRRGTARLAGAASGLLRRRSHRRSQRRALRGGSPGRGLRGGDLAPDAGRAPEGGGESFHGPGGRGRGGGVRSLGTVRPDTCGAGRPAGRDVFRRRRGPRRAAERVARVPRGRAATETHNHEGREMDL